MGLRGETVNHIMCIILDREDVTTHSFPSILTPYYTPYCDVPPADACMLCTDIEILQLVAFSYKLQKTFELSLSQHLSLLKNHYYPGQRLGMADMYRFQLS